MVRRTPSREISSSAGSAISVTPITVSHAPVAQTLRPPRLMAWSAAFLAGVVLSVSMGGLPAEAQARRYQQPETSTQSEVIPLSRLPAQAQDVHRRILAGGPFRYAKDGVVFGNRERILPRQYRGFYREYTVPTPGERDRGARRIVCGGKEVHEPETCFYTEDHYSSFQQIDPRR
jgi:ribonuclease T1